MTANNAAARIVACLIVCVTLVFISWICVFGLARWCWVGLAVKLFVDGAAGGNWLTTVSHYAIARGTNVWFVCHWDAQIVAYTLQQIPSPFLVSDGDIAVCTFDSHDVIPAPGIVARPRFFATASVRERTWSFS